MRYFSTRGLAPAVTSAGAIRQGLASDGGLYVPEYIPGLPKEKFSRLLALNYNQLAVEVLQLFLTDFSRDELQKCVDGAYSPRNFPPQVAPVVRLSEKLFILELWHGPTCAFKDFALTILPRFLPLAATKCGEQEEIVILVATSGDTGKAALVGFQDVPGTRIIVFYPYDGVSRVQELQMITQEGQNVAVVAVKGNFDDAQSGVKAIFNDATFNKRLLAAGMKFSSANSINWGRLVPQIVYYFHAYLELCRHGALTFGKPVNFVVPTGNFGNILAGFYARSMGLPIKRLILAANRNHVLADFLATGTYDRRRTFYLTNSPSMDILISSNLERLLYHASGGDSEKVAAYMRSLNDCGYYTISPDLHTFISEIFSAGYTDDENTLATIHRVFYEQNYLLDTHTAVGYHVYEQYCRQNNDPTPTVLVSTASPFKFNYSVARALFPNDCEGKDEFALLEMLSERTGWPVPTPLKGLSQRPVRHRRIVAREEMAAVVAEILGLVQV